MHGLPYWEGGIRTPDAGTKNQSLNRLATSQQRIRQYMKTRDLSSGLLQLFLECRFARV